LRYLWRGHICAYETRCEVLLYRLRLGSTEEATNGGGCSATIRQLWQPFPAGPPLLQPSMRGGGDQEAPGYLLRSMRREVRSEERQCPILLAVMRSKADRKSS